jgi:hypothetical protein
MAITNDAVSTVDETVVPTVDRAFVASPIGWSSIFAATAITLGVWLALHLFGLAVGLTAIDPHDADSLRGVGIGTGVWSLIAPIIALFVGGLVAGRAAPTINSVNAAIHGAVVWAVSAIFSMILIAMTIGAVTRMAVRTGTAVGASAGAAISQLGDVDLSDLGLSSEDLVAPINQRLAQRGMPPVSAGDVEAVVRDAVRQSVRTGSVDRAALIDSVARRTNLSREDATVLAGEIEQRIDRAQTRASAGVDRVREAALSAAETSGKLLFALFGTLALGLAAAVGGSVLAVRRERRTHVHLPRATSRTVYTEPTAVDVDRR